MCPTVRHAAPRVCALLSELALRTVLLFLLYTLHTRFTPPLSPIPQHKLILYNYPRQPSIVPIWAVTLIIIVFPFIILCVPLLVSGDFVETSQALLGWSLALSVNAVITVIVKLLVGRPRPDYFFRCFPNGKIAETYTGHWKQISDGRKSFPSGHSSFSFCSMGYLFFWMLGQTWASGRRLGRTTKLACAVPLLVSTAVAGSRWLDNHHHAGDVVAGSILGITVSYFCYRSYYNDLRSSLAGYPLIENCDSDY